MPAHIDGHLHQQTFVLEFGNSAGQLVTTADGVEADWLRSTRPSCFRGSSHPLDFAAGDSVMAAGSLGRANLALLDPLLQRRITNARQLGRVYGF